MSYRIKDHKPCKPNRTVQDTTTVSKVFVQNGTTANLAFPCWYMEVMTPKRACPHSRQLHDHIGWPSPTHPDHICQAWDYTHENDHLVNGDGKGHRGYCRKLLDLDELIPIHLSREGYTGIKVAFTDAPSGLTAKGSIDAEKDWIVRVIITAKCSDAIEEKLEVPYSVFATGGTDMTDIVATGQVVILPGPYA